MKADTLRKPRARKRAASDGESRQGTRLLGPRVVRYSLRVSKDDRSFAELLSDVIERYYESDSDLAASAGISPSTVSRLVSGQATPSPATIRKLAPHMRTTEARLRAIVYRDEHPTELGADGPQLHPLAIDLGRMLASDSAVPSGERSTLETLVTAVMAPYRRYLRTRKSA